MNEHSLILSPKGHTLKGRRQGGRRDRDKQRDRESEKEEGLSLIRCGKLRLRIIAQESNTHISTDMARLNKADAHVQRK
jgi:hypothetical protein